MIFRFYAPIHTLIPWYSLAIGNATSCLSMFCFDMKSHISFVNLGWLHHRAMSLSINSTQLTCRWGTPTWHLCTFFAPLSTKTVKSHSIFLKNKDNPLNLLIHNLTTPQKKISLYKLLFFVWKFHTSLNLQLPSVSPCHGAARPSFGAARCGAPQRRHGAALGGGFATGGAGEFLRHDRGHARTWLSGWPFPTRVG